MTNRKYDINRHDHSQDRSLRAWSAADEYLLKKWGELEQRSDRVYLYNDRFGYLSCHLSDFSPTVVLTQKSQENAIRLNLEANGIPLVSFSHPLASFEEKVEVALLKMPKSFELFRLFLDQIIRNSSDNVRVVCAFMTRHFGAKMLEIAGEYFEEVEQSRAQKKARLLLLSKKKQVGDVELIDKLIYQEQEYRQYSGVFSGNHIDYATQFLLENIQLEPSVKRALDLGAGNAVIAKEINGKQSQIEFHLVDDSYLAVESAKLNFEGENIRHHWDCNLDKFDADYFDLIVSNPPFHFEYEVNIQIPIRLFQSCFRCLKEDGSFQLVANQHLNYKTHLEKIFPLVEVLAENSKFVVYRCTK